jgi:hypothetical protein
VSVREVRPLTRPQLAIDAIDEGAQAAMTEASGAVRPIIVRLTPRRSGRLAEALQPRVTRSKRGIVMTVGARPGARHGNVSVSDVVRFVTRGTGLYRTTGPRHVIRGRRREPLKLPFGPRWTARGQRPDPFITRIEIEATPRVEAIARKAAEDAARAAERVI